MVRPAYILQVPHRACFHTIAHMQLVYHEIRRDIINLWCHGGNISEQVIGIRKLFDRIDLGVCDVQIGMLDRGAMSNWPILRTLVLCNKKIFQMACPHRE